MKPLTPAEIARARNIIQSNAPPTTKEDQQLVDNFVAQFLPPAKPELMSIQPQVPAGPPDQPPAAPAGLMSIQPQVPAGPPDQPAYNLIDAGLPPLPPQGARAQYLIGAGAAPPAPSDASPIMDAAKWMFSALPVPGPDAAYDQPYVAPPPKPPVIPGMHPDRRAAGTQIGLNLPVSPKLTPEEARFIDEQHRRDGVPNGGPNMVTQVATSGPAAGLEENAAASRTELNWLERQAEKLGSNTPEKRKNLGSFLVGFGGNIANSTGAPLQSIATAIGAGEQNRLLSVDNLRQVAQQDQELAWKKEAMDQQRIDTANARTDRQAGLDATAAAKANNPLYGMDLKSPFGRLAFTEWAKSKNMSEDDINRALDYKLPVDPNAMFNQPLQP